MYTFFRIKMVVNEIATSYLVLSTYINVWLYIQNCKSESISCLNIRDLKCEVGATVYTVVLLYT